MAEMIDFGKVTSVHLQQGGWYEVDSGTFTIVPAANFLSGHPGGNAFSWKSHGSRLACPCSALVLVRYSM